jgi:hypothetical protein
VIRKIHTIGIAAALICVVTALTLCIAGCGSTPPPLVPADLSPSFGNDKPSWIDNYPTDVAFYIGVGSSKTGIQGEDLEIAKSKALVALASSISTEIKSELSITAREDSQGGAYESAEQVIRETVDANLREVEVADSYYSEDDGYWFYLRLSKVVWESIQSEEANRLSRRVVGIVEPSLTDDLVPIVSRLGALWKGWLLLVESPYASLIETSMDGEYGVLLDLIENRMVGYIDTLSIVFRPAVLKTVPRRAVPVEIDVESSSSLKPGETSVLLSFPGTAYQSIDVTTDTDGTYSGSIVFPVDQPGSVRIVANIDFSHTELDFERIPKRFIFPQTDAMLDVSPVTAFLDVAAPEEIGLANVRGSFESLISAKLPVKLTGLGEADYEIKVEIVARSAPPNDFGLVIVFTKAFVSVGKDGNVFASYESPEFKNGGLDLSQAHTRAFAGLVEHLNGSEDLRKSLEKAFAIEVQ